MRWGVLVPFAVLLLAASQAAPSFTPHSPSRDDLVFPGEQAVQLSAGPEGATTISSDKHGAKSTTTGASGSNEVDNTTVVDNMLSSSRRVRLNVISLSNVGDCNNCRIQLRKSGTTSQQIIINNGALTQGYGNWETITAGTNWHVYNVAKRKGSVDNTATVKYQLEIVTTGATSPSVGYHNMTVDFLV